MVDKDMILKVVSENVRKAVVSQKSFIIAANWKMHKTARDVFEYLQSLSRLQWSDKNTVILFPPSIYLFMAKELLKGSRARYGLQNMHWEKQGAYTGEISPGMAVDLGCRYAIIGHSERRNIFHESDEMLKKKVEASFEYGISPVFCIGENLEERKANRFKDRIKQQITSCLNYKCSERYGNLIIAYEPVWAIGTGLNAAPEQVEEAHGYISEVLRDSFGQEIAAKIPILYGGSVKPGNIAEIAAAKGVSGFLIGGASLKIEEFYGMIKSLE